MSQIPKTLIVTIQENESNIYEYENNKVLFNSTIDNDMTTSYEEGNNNWQEFPTGRGKIVGGNEGQWKADVNKHQLKYTFEGLNNLYKTPTIKAFKVIVIFYSSNTPKEDLEEQIKHFKNNHHDLEVHIIGKNLTDHEAVEKGIHNFYKE
jgi:hypothetical protein